MPELRTYDALVQEAFAVGESVAAANAAYEIESLRAALQAAKDLAMADAPAHMIVDVCTRGLAVQRSQRDKIGRGVCHT